MDNELKNRLHNVDATATNGNNNINYSNNNNNNNKNIYYNKMLFINNYLNSRIFKKSHKNYQYQHNHQYYYNFNKINHLTILQILLTIFLIFILRTTTINCLPITSKPIENTPEHLAWEAWIMLPPSANLERHRKIMPKSIFVLPSNNNNSNKDRNQLPIPQPQIQCPPGYRVDNSKCIPTISINRDQLLIDQLTNLLPVSTKPDDSNYDDYDYDYSNGETINYDLDMLQSYHQQQLPTLISNNNNNPNSFKDSEKNSEPLKINFSLDKFTIAKDDNNNNNNNNKPAVLDIRGGPNEFVMELNNDSSNEEIKLRPFRDQEASSSVIDLSTTTTNDEVKEIESNSTISIEIDTPETEIEKQNENVSESNLQQQQQNTTVNDQNEFSTTTSTITENSETTSESNDSVANTNTPEFNKKSSTESKREPIVTTTTTTTTSSPTTEISNNDNKNNNNNTTSDQNDSLELSNLENNSNVFITTISTIDSSTVVPLLSSEENEMSGIIENENDFNSSTTSDYEYDQMTTLNRDENDSDKDQSIEIVTEQMEKEKNLEEKLSEESLVLDKSIEENFTESSSEISLEDDITTNSPIYEDNSSEQFDLMSSSSSTTVSNNIERSTTERSSLIASSTQTSEPDKIVEDNKKLEHKIVHVDHHRHHNNHHSIPQSSVSISASQPIEWHEDREPLMESIESNNRFVYHHLGSSTVPEINRHQIASTQSQSTVINDNLNINENIQPTAATQIKRDSEADINEQLRIINMIVEENKRRAQASKIQFPTTDVDSTLPTSATPLRSQTLVRFPNEQVVSTPYQITSSYYQSQNGRFDPEKLIFHRRFFHQQYPSTTQTPPSSTTTTTTTSTQKPFWWLPPGWKIDQSSDRPTLIRFWSRSPLRNSEQFTGNTESYIDPYKTASSSNSHQIVNENSYLHRITNNNNFNINTSDGLHSQYTTTTTSRYRENSRSPTDSLYREVPSSQNVYKVLNAARQWKYSKR